MPEKAAVSDGEIIRAEGIHVGYNGNEVISGLDFSVNRGDVVAVLGPNGSGKTTLLKAVLGILPVSKGTLRIFGKPRLGAGEAERLIAYIPQRMQIDRTFPISLREMLALGGKALDADTYIDMLELRELLGRRVGELSGGQMQRALLAYAIIKRPELLVMDEPTSWVDVKGVHCVLCIMEEFKRNNISIVIVSHELSELKSVCTHVLGIGPGPGHRESFFERVDSPSLDDKLRGIFGSPHDGHPVHCPPFEMPKGKAR